MTEKTRYYSAFFLKAGFSPVGRDAFSVFQAFDCDSGLIDLTPTLINTWGASMDALYCSVAGQLCTVWFCDGNPYHGGQPFYFTVMKSRNADGGALKDMIDRLYVLVRKAGLPFLLIESIDESWLGEFTNIGSYTIDSSCSADHSEYAYKTGDFLDLSGHINKNKRERLKKMFKAAGLSVLPMTGENVRYCLEIEKRWCGSQDCAVCSSYAGCERKALDIMADIYNEKNHLGLFLCGSDGPTGYCIGERKNKKVAFVYFSKGIKQDYMLYMLTLMVKRFFSGVEYLNFGEDMGNPGIKMFKSHLGPFEYWRKHQCIYTIEGEGNDK